MCIENESKGEYTCSRAPYTRFTSVRVYHGKICFVVYFIMLIVKKKPPTLVKHHKDLDVIWLFSIATHDQTLFLIWPRVELISTHVYIWRMYNIDFKTLSRKQIPAV